MADTTSEQRPASPPARRAESQPARQEGGLKAEAEAAYKARVGVPGHDNVDARLDSRQGAFRPPMEEFPAKPQQVDGPDIIHQAEHTRETLSAREAEGPVKGMFSPGPHGLGDDTAIATEDDRPLKA